LTSSVPPSRFAAWTRRFQKLAGDLVESHEDQVFLVLTLVIGATVGLVIVAFIVLSERLGVGYGHVGEALNGRMALQMMALLVVPKILATTTCYSSGNAGGIFGPSLFIGAMMGGGVGSIVHQLFPDQTATAGAYALVGMGATFAGIIRVPITSIIMIRPGDDGERHCGRLQLPGGEVGAELLTEPLAPSHPSPSATAGSGTPSANEVQTSARPPSPRRGS
jgi:hypothetical protein